MAQAPIHRKTTTTVTVSTPRCDPYVNAWAVRQFAAALDKAGIPDNARVIATHDTNTYHLERLRVEHVIDIDQSQEFVEEA